MFFISLLIVILVLFLQFIFTAEGVSDSAKRVALALGVISGIGILLALIWG